MTLSPGAADHIKQGAALQARSLEGSGVTTGGNSRAHGLMGPSANSRAARVMALLPKCTATAAPSRPVTA